MNRMEYFFSKTTKSGDCIIWIASRNQNGYGMFWDSGKYVRAHRWIYAELNGNIPKTLFICHRCDNPSCVKPEHLFAGTNADNQSDMIKKGRDCKARGEAASKAKLTTQQVIDLRKLHVDGHSHRRLGEIFNISHNAVGSIVRRESWKHI